MAAASDAVRGLIAGPWRRCEVVVAVPGAVYLHVSSGEPGRDLVAVLAGDAVRVPVGVVIAEQSGRRPFARVKATSSAGIGDGRVELDGRVWQVSRWWRAALPPLGGAVDPSAVAALGRQVPTATVATSPQERALESALDSTLESVLRSGLRSGAAGDRERLAQAVASLVGLGGGLTPEGDDVLAGLLVSLAAADDCEGRRAVVDAVLASLGSTTVVSRALLRAAVDGQAIPQLAAFVQACARDRTTATGTACQAGPDVQQLDVQQWVDHQRLVVQQLVAVGHRSGAALARGALIGMRSVLAAQEEAA